MSLLIRHQKITWFSVIGIAVILISLFYYTNVQAVQTTDKDAVHTVQATDTKAVHIEHMHGDIIDRYETIETLKAASDIVAVVEVSESKNILHDELPFTLTTSTIKKVYKGTIKNNDSINILETGGFIDDVEYAFEGNRVLKTKEKAVVFLQKYEGPIASDAYVVVGVFQGKFKEENNKLKPSKEVLGELNTVTSLDSLELKLK